MTSRELVVKTLNHEPVARVPRDLWLPAEDALPADDVAEINLRYPSDLVTVASGPLQGKRSHGKPNKPGDFTDAWDCVWHVAAEGATPELKQAPLAETAKIAGYQPPAELFDPARFASADKACQGVNRFTLAWAEVRPFDRFKSLRGRTAAAADVSRGTKALRGLLAMLHDAACKELELWAKTEVDGVVLSDVCATPDGLAIAADAWREHFRPLYRDFCDILHANDKFVFFHGEGDTSDIFADLIKSGVDAIHGQSQYMDVERLAKRFRGRVTFWAGIDPAKLRDPGTAAEFREAVLEVRRAFDIGAGGVIAQCSWEPGVRLQTVAAYFEHWLAPPRTIGRGSDT